MPGRLATRPNERTALASDNVEALLRAAPQLRVFDADVGCDTVAEASRLLRGEPLFAPLRVRALTVHEFEEEAPDEADVLAFAPVVAGHAWLAQLTLAGVPLNTAAVLAALVDAALACRLRAVELWRCQLSPASAPALARLLGGGLARLAISDMQSLDLPSALPLSHALRASMTLTCLELRRVDFWHDPAAAVLLLGALAGHPSLRELNVSCNEAATPALQGAAGAALGAVVGANAPALRTLNVAGCRFGDVGMGLLLDALPHNTHLRTLWCWNNGITGGFACERVLPAVLATSSLQDVSFFSAHEQRQWPAIAHAVQDLVAARTAAAAPQ